MGVELSEAARSEKNICRNETVYGYTHYINRRAISFLPGIAVTILIKIDSCNIHVKIIQLGRDANQKMIESL